MSVATLKPMNATEVASFMPSRSIPTPNPSPRRSAIVLANAADATTMATPIKANTMTPKYTPTSSTPTSSSSSPSYRLLYRGALSLPDSLILLDGLTFGARLDSPSKSASKQKAANLLENPLALALESMRGRPSLRLLGTVRLDNVWMDESGGVEMDIHPFAVLSKIYFENMFCLMPFDSTISSRRSEIGLKVAIGDSDGPETTEIVIFAQVSDTSTSASVSLSTVSPSTIRLCVGRLCQRPQSVQPQKRVPRPDDPIPRKPPAFFIRDLKRAGSLGVVGGRELKRVASGSGLGPAPVKKAKLMDAAGLVDTGSVFKVPELPVLKQAAVKAKGKGKEKDVFGEVSDVERIQQAAVNNTKGKQKAEDVQVLSVDENALEKANKNVIKRATIEYLGRTKDPTGKYIDKTHSDFKDLYGFIYRGVGFALRVKMRTCTLDLGVVDRLVDMHAMMYLGGCGGSAQVMW